MQPTSFFYGAMIAVIVVATASFISLFFGPPAQYGRHDKGKSGPQIPTRLAWIIMEAPASLVFAWFYFTGPNATGLVPIVLFLMWQAHYFHRSFIYPFQLKVREGSKTTVYPILMGSAFCAVNGYLNGIYTSTYGAHLNREWLTDPRFAIGIALFIFGYALNKQSDRILLSLRAPGESGYKIPYGGGYRWVSSPNYLGELITWIGFAIASWSPAAATFIIMTTGNLVPRALTNHRWYQKTFEDYPKDRKAIFPFLF
jgi:3-oxo-5-alpha-steroid 4-dehydrogenase 1